MQNPSPYSQIKPQVQPKSQYPDQEHLKCPRCDSTDTKFCYYNNYNLSQPRHFCKNCKRYWTKGGALRNVPVGGGSRKISKRRPTAAASDSHQNKRLAVATTEQSPSNGENCERQFGSFTEGVRSFSSFFGSSDEDFGNFPAQLGTSDGPTGLQLSEHFAGPDPGSLHHLDPEVGLECGSSSCADGFLNLEGGNEWPDLAMYTPRTNYH